MQGPYSFKTTPFLKEIINCFDPMSDVREVAMRKGVQIGATVGILENVILYYIGYVRTAPMMMMTADSELAQVRMESYITPMINESGLDDRIRSLDIKNHRKTGKTDKKIEWIGGGWLVPFGAQNAAKMRSMSIQVLLCDEIDGWPLKAGRDGDACSLVLARTAAFEKTRKVLWISTPLETGTSKIDVQYYKGDQRKFYIPCRGCGEMQVLRFTGSNADGTLYGLVYKTNADGTLIPGSVRYACQFCQHEHINEDKVWFLPRGEWRATAEPSYPGFRSYDLPALYSPEGFQSWEAQIRQYLDCYDVVEQRILDVNRYQTFYNNVLGRSFSPESTSLTVETVRNHRSTKYKSGMVPNRLAVKDTGKHIGLLVMSVDVHDKHLDYQVVGFCRNLVSYSIAYGKLIGDCSGANRGEWAVLKKIIMTKKYQADDGRVYPVAITLIDSQYNADLVYRFCNQFAVGVIPIGGRDKPQKNSAYKEFRPFKTKAGSTGYHIVVDIYKDRCSNALRNTDRVPDGTFVHAGKLNFPLDYTEAFFKELTSERRVKVKDKNTGKVYGHKWEVIGDRQNHAWDLTIYAQAALDLLVANVCELRFGIDYIDYDLVFELNDTEQLYYALADPDCAIIAK